MEFIAIYAHKKKSDVIIKCKSNLTVNQQEEEREIFIPYGDYSEKQDINLEEYEEITNKAIQLALLQSHNENIYNSATDFRKSHSSNTFVEYIKQKIIFFQIIFDQEDGWMRIHTITEYTML